MPIIIRLKYDLFIIQALEVLVMLLIDHMHGYFVCIFVYYLIVFYVMSMLLHRCLQAVRVRLLHERLCVITVSRHDITSTTHRLRVFSTTIIRCIIHTLTR
jgi:hypothetical protein